MYRVARNGIGEVNVCIIIGRSSVQRAIEYVSLYMTSAFLKFSHKGEGCFRVWELEVVTWLAA